MTSPTPNRRTVMIATPEPLGHRRAGPAVRAIRMAEAVAQAGHDVILVSTAESAPEVAPPGVQVVHGSAIPASADVVIATGRAVLDLPWITESDAVVGFDLYDPFQLESLHRGDTDRIRRIDLVEGAHHTLATQLVRGDKFFCANDAQRALWLGYLGALGRLNPATHDADPTGDCLIELAPFGVDDTPPVAGESPLRSTPGIESGDAIAVWAGGLHDWLDPVTAVRAVARAAARCPVRLVFVTGTGTNEAARREADILGATGTTVFFHPDWIPHDERGAMLLDATLGVCAHGRHLETEFSHRTRFLDHLWAGLPTVTTGLDPLSAQLAGAGAARVTPPEDVDALADSIVHIVTDEESHRTMAAAARKLGRTLTWRSTMAPVVRWVDDATPAADRVDPTIGPRLGGAAHTPRSLTERLRLQWQTEGARGVAARTRRRLGRPRS